MDGILDYDNIHGYGREETFSDRYNNKAIDMSNEDLRIVDLPNLESKESAEQENQAGTGLRILTSNQILSRIQITLAQLNP